MLMLEKKSLVDELEEVCKMEGIDGFIVGRNDPSQSTGRFYSDCEREIDQLAQDAMDICVANNKCVGVFQRRSGRSSQMGKTRRQYDDNRR